MHEADIQLKFTATNANPEFKGSKTNPLLGLIRFEFLEVFFRLAEEKYIKKYN